MKTEHASRYLHRTSILKLLSNEEIARMRSSEGGPALAVGDEYIDLCELDRGVRRADGSRLSLRRVLPKKALSELSWVRVVAQLQIMAM